MDLYNTAATDAAGGIAMIGWAGLIFLFGAVSGADYHSLGRLRWQGRYIALAASNVVLWGITLVMMATNNVTIRDLWEAAFVWKNSPTGPFGWAVFVVVMSVFVSPLLSLYALLSVELQRRRESSAW